LIIDKKNKRSVQKIMHVIGIEPDLAAPKSDALAASTATHSPEESETFLLYIQQTSSVSLYKISWYPHSHSKK